MQMTKLAGAAAVAAAATVLLSACGGGGSTSSASTSSTNSAGNASASSPAASSGATSASSGGNSSPAAQSGSNSNSNSAENSGSGKGSTLKSGNVCGKADASGSALQSAPANATVSPPAGALFFSIQRTKLGFALTDSSGIVLYTYSGDKSGMGSCEPKSLASTWMPVVGTPIESIADKWPSSDTFTKTSTGQIAFNGMPLYYKKGAPAHMEEETSQFKIIKMPTPSAG